MRSNGIQGAKRRGKPWRTTKRDLQARGGRPILSSGTSWRRARSRKIVGWQLATHMRTDLVLEALKMALAQRGAGADVELIHHSDRGSQYTSID